MLVGGGFQDFTNGRLKDATGDGGYWTARIVAGTRQYVGMEAAYVGDARSITGLGLGNDSRLISNGLEGNLRLNIPIVRGRVAASSRSASSASAGRTTRSARTTRRSPT